jgi:hypothetical protein
MLLQVEDAIIVAVAARTMAVLKKLRRKRCKANSKCFYLNHTTSLTSAACESDVKLYEQFASVC